MDRRTFLKQAGAVLGGAAAGARLVPAATSGRAASGKRPNVLIIIADDVNDYGFYGTLPAVKTPYLEKFKRTAVTFDKAYCAAPACVPSRAAVFSGLYPHNTGSYLNGSDPWKNSPFTEIESMPECFKRNGYTTFGRGKLFHSQPEPKSYTTTRATRISSTTWQTKRAWPPSRSAWPNGSQSGGPGHLAGASVKGQKGMRQRRHGNCRIGTST